MYDFTTSDNPKIMIFSLSLKCDNYDDWVTGLHPHYKQYKNLD